MFIVVILACLLKLHASVRLSFFQMIFELFQIYLLLVSLQVMFDHISKAQRVRHVKLFYCFFFHQRKRWSVADLCLVSRSCCLKLRSSLLCKDAQFSWILVVPDSLRWPFTYSFMLKDIFGRLSIDFLACRHLWGNITAVYLRNLSKERVRWRKLF